MEDGTAVNATTAVPSATGSTISDPTVVAAVDTEYVTTSPATDDTTTDAIPAWLVDTVTDGSDSPFRRDCPAPCDTTTCAPTNGEPA